MTPQNELIQTVRKLSPAQRRLLGVCAAGSRVLWSSGNAQDAFDALRALGLATVQTIASPGGGTLTEVRIALTPKGQAAWNAFQADRDRKPPTPNHAALDQLFEEAPAKLPEAPQSKADQLRERTRASMIAHLKRPPRAPKTYGKGSRYRYRNCKNRPKP